MALPIFIWSLSRTGYSFGVNEDDVVSSQLQGPVPQIRKGLDKNFLLVNVGFALVGSDIDAFLTFYRTTLLNGALPFQVALIIDSHELTNHKAFFMPGSLKQNKISPDAMYFSAQFEVEPLNYDIDTGQAIVNLYNEFGDGWETEFPTEENELDQVVNEDLPEVF
jgi:hypothetical protein